MPTLADLIANIKQEEIAGQVEAIRDEIKRLNALVDFNYSAIKALQKICAHPTTRKRSAMGKETWKECTVCGKEL